MRFSEPLESRKLFADFSVAFTADSIPDAAKAGDKLKGPSATFSVASTGTLDKTQGKAKLTLDVAITGNGTTVNAKQIKITASQLAKKAKVAKAVFSTLKVAPASGTYTITATLAGDLATGGDTNAANNTVSTTFTIATGSSNPGGTTSDKPWPNSQLGNIIIFGNDDGGTFIPGEAGGFYDFKTPSNIGTWTLSPTGSKQIFTLDFTGEAGNEIVAETANTTSFANKAFQFGVDKADAQGFLDITQVGGAKTKIRLYFKQV